MIELEKDWEEDWEVNIYLFGSFLKRKQSNDIDLLIIYNSISFRKVKDVKKNISYQLQDMFGIPVHFTTLSREELLTTHGIVLTGFHSIYVREV